MDTNIIRHMQQYLRERVIVSLVLSCTIIVMSAFVARGFLHIKGALSAQTNEEPTEVSVAVAMEQDGFTELLDIREVSQLRKTGNQYDFLVTTEDGDGVRQFYLVQLVRRESKWRLKGHSELLHQQAPRDDDELNAAPKGE